MDLFFHTYLTHPEMESFEAVSWALALFCSLAILDPRVGRTRNVLSPFISVLCHYDWLFHRESCPHLDVVYPGRAWSSSPACTWHCSLHYPFLPCIIFFSMQLPCFLTSFLALTVSDSSPFTPAVLRTHSVFSLLSTKPTEFFSVLLSQRCQNMFLHSFSMSSFRSRMLLQATLALSLAVSSLKSVCCDFSTFSAVMPCAFSALTLLVGR